MRECKIDVVNNKLREEEKKWDNEDRTCEKKRNKKGEN